MPPPDAVREPDDVPEEGAAVPLQVGEHDVDGLASVLCRAALGAAPGEIDGQRIDGGLDVSQLDGSLFGGEHGRGRDVPARGLGPQAQSVAQLGEEFGASTQRRGDLLGGHLAIDGMQDATQPLERLVDPRVGHRPSEKGVRGAASATAPPLEIEVGQVEGEAMVVAVGVVVEGPLRGHPEAEENTATLGAYAIQPTSDAVEHYG